jgi:hypothetical protein
MINAQKTMSTYEKRSNHLKKMILKGQRTLDKRRSLLLKHNTFLNQLRDSGRVTKEEIELFFKKD